VFTNLEEAVFMFKPTREGGFLHDLLKDFHRVLVPGFYAAYDSIECPQQQCLIHLMRDINQEVLNNPFDEELRLITRPFGSLLRSIIATIDEHGLKRTYLRKHEEEGIEYFLSLSAHSFRSEAAEALRVRLIKYQDKLFTLLNTVCVEWSYSTLRPGWVKGQSLESKSLRGRFIGSGCFPQGRLASSSPGTTSR
jgi:Transposase IS66 family